MIDFLLSIVTRAGLKREGGSVNRSLPLVTGLVANVRLVG